MKHKLSFLMPAHNEEKTIYNSLNNLLNLPYKNYEVIIGLDGCTDKTEDIVKEFCTKSKRFKFYKLNLRKGKPAVINLIIKKSRGDIIIIHDADWIYRLIKIEDIDKIVSYFDNPNVGGIAESFPVHYIPEIMREKSILELGVIWSAYAWIDYIKNKYTIKKNGIIILDKYFKFPLLVNIFRKDLYENNISLGDDFERCIDIINKGKDVVILENEKMPRMVMYEEKVTLNGLLKQKQRTAIARWQINEKYGTNYSLGFGFYWHILKLIFKLKMREKIGLIFYIIIFSFANTKNKFNEKKSTEKGWEMRLER